MKVIEIFESIQGEGRWVGTPVTFIRLAGCNLHCPWCDTKESWGDVGTEMSIYDVCNQVKEFDNRIVVLTGGEPTIQPLLSSLIRTLSENGYYVAIETNGTNNITHTCGVKWITCSPKPESQYRVSCDADEIKLVITEDFDEAVLQNLTLTYNKDIWLQPEGSNMQAMWKCCYDLAMKYKGNVRVGVQLHKLMEVR